MLRLSMLCLRPTTGTTSRLSKAQCGMGPSSSVLRSFSSQDTKQKISESSRPIFDKILIANRGEIACRVISTCRKMGIRTVAVYSEADTQALHVKLADEAFLIGPPPARESYLQSDRIIQVAKRAGAQAIHPGYGFLSENAAFAELCSQPQNNIEFIGPPPAAIRAMGSKSESKNIMINAQVPVVPGYHGTQQSEEFLFAEAQRIGFPLLIKAVMGGGGKGMRIVHRPADFIDALRSSKRESLSSFGDDSVLMERYLTKPRHVEIQVFADKLGNAVYLFERDCSVQRRHQKILEEAPAPFLGADIRRKMGESAVAAAKAVGYVGAGTVEFMLDEDGKTYYFMEMNTRLQVEHPVTEMITGQDLVEWQLKVAAGHRLPLQQDQLKCNGHAFEARIYAENPSKEFLPASGKILRLRTPEPANTPFSKIRIETGVQEGDEVGIFYDPMVAKLVVWGENREDALNRLRLALNQYEISGLTTNIDFLGRLASHPAFIRGNLDTNFIQRYGADLFKQENVQTTSHKYVLAAFVAIMKDQQRYTQSDPNKSDDKHNPWSSVMGKRLNTVLKRNIEFLPEDGDQKKPIVVEVSYTDQPNSFQMKYQNQVFKVKGDADANNADRFAIFVDDARYKMNASVIDTDSSTEIHLFTPTPQHQLSEPVRLTLRSASYDPASLSQSGGGADALHSPMPGKIIKVLVDPKQQVKKGQSLLIMEAMKMEHTIRAPADGVVQKVFYKPGDMVKEKQVLISLGSGSS